ncbi:bifunctional alpha,alpha-trehalose-phosphate synthase (UDP-forming)/trehalose-phosphatase [Spirosoma sp. RP8]|uniref:Bifunctional alpha,alpha-trehalose-phosphate synthase (UDP-forming)/trehalose-phosphatase n=1 Tax=Spirosoma liriopis TaxID=2937440 RepID=A0ABT0HLD2_9BACT|nr:bifunctional alpha,alpha-trehalose-phosphate synthase (UDP-forming)/trehalose-phosphatase [Spirosoma liriopis]MCK8492948.1 bifunctional alpha,alpha-trehalose-phosphate synthase (UDP-forming)/trehalose-phosphatase [Spirosoma liriopis]
MERKNYMSNLNGTYKRLIIVAYRLPFSIKQTKEGVSLFQNSGGLVSAVLSMAEQMGQSAGDSGPKIHWIGHCDNSLKDIQQSAFEDEHFVAHPVFVDEDVHQAFYEGFCNDLIWPLFHYFPTFASFQENYFDAYQQVNNRFLEELTSIIEPGDLVWIHDFQLMLLPDLLRKAVPEATIGYFFHIPFPTFEIIKLLPRTWRQALMNGLLGADVVGFHTADYVKHFMHNVSEVVGLPIIEQRVVLDDRSVFVGDFPISIDFTKFDEGSQLEAVAEMRQHYQQLLNGNKIIFSVDRLDYAKGITYRLQGYERFLTQNPDWHNNVTFVMTVVPSRDKIGHYQEIKREIEETVGRINGLFGTIGWRPIVYSYLSLTFTELLALYTCCDVALITPIRDGMNLVCKEFIASRRDNQGVLILSELAGAAQELPDALIINPTDTQEVTAAIKEALEMQPAEQQDRMQKMRQHLQNHNVFRWSHNFLSAFMSDESWQSELATNLPIQSFIDAYQKAQHRLLLVDFDGTLAPIVNDPAKAQLSPTMQPVLHRLAEQNDLAIISGRNRAFLENAFRGFPVTLVAEHGSFIKKPDQDWQLLDMPASDWIEPVRATMNEYVDAYPESFIEEKETTIVWHYRNAKAEDIETKAVELATRLLSTPSAVKLTVMQGSKVIEVRTAQHSKGTIAQKLFEQTDYDFIVSMGDDTTDEDMFRQLPNWAYTLKVGAGITNARYRLARQRDVEMLLQQLDEVAINH